MCSLLKALWKSFFEDGFCSFHKLLRWDHPHGVARVTVHTEYDLIDLGMCTQVGPKRFILVAIRRDEMIFGIIEIPMVLHVLNGDVGHEVNAGFKDQKAVIAAFFGKAIPLIASRHNEFKGVFSFTITGAAQKGGNGLAFFIIA